MAEGVLTSEKMDFVLSKVIWRGAVFILSKVIGRVAAGCGFACCERCDTGGGDAGVEGDPCPSNRDSKRGRMHSFSSILGSGFSYSPKLSPSSSVDALMCGSISGALGCDCDRDRNLRKGAGDGLAATVLFGVGATEALRLDKERALRRRGVVVAP